MDSFYQSINTSIRAAPDGYLMETNCIKTAQLTQVARPAPELSLNCLEYETKKIAYQDYVNKTADHFNLFIKNLSLFCMSIYMLGLYGFIAWNSQSANRLLSPIGNKLRRKLRERYAQ